MKKSVYEMIYEKLQHLRLLDESGKMQAEYLKFKSSGLMDLNVDNLLNNRIALAHNGMQNGDVMSDPDVEVQIYPVPLQKIRLLHKIIKNITIRKFNHFHSSVNDI
jgi:hypothetical protein